MESKKKTKKKTSGKRSRLPVLLAVVCAAGILVVGVLAWWTHAAKAPYQGDTTRIYIPRGATETDIRDTLSLRLGQDFGEKVYRAWSWRGGDPARAVGSYVVSPGDEVISVSHKLLVHAEDPVRVTFNNIRTIDQLAQRVAGYLAFEPADFVNACDSVLPSMGYKAAEYPAAFLPDTYEFYWTAAPDYVVRRLVSTRDKFWTPERLNMAKGLGLTPEQVATVASIVEEETAKADERSKVARLYLNRLDRGMKLQADPTVKFAVGDFSLRRITSRHLGVDSPYNTYLYPGLPPGPIRVVERKTLDAVLYAPVHPYIYMCAKEDFSGYHNFAVSDAEHMANARRYHAALNRRGIR